MLRPHYLAKTRVRFSTSVNRDLTERARLPSGLLLAAAALFGRLLCAWKSALEEFDLAIVVGFVFGDVKPFGIIVS
jgi:hypothetical protein